MAPFGLRATARALGVDHAHLKRLADTKQVPRNADGTFDVEAARVAMKRNVDPAFSRKPTMRKSGDSADHQSPPRHQSPRPVISADETGAANARIPEHLAFVARYDGPFDRGAALVAALIVYRAGATAANMALAAGASMKVAFTLHGLATVAFANVVEDVCREAGVDPTHLRYWPDLTDDLDWEARARDVCEPHDPAAWEAWKAERFAFLEADARTPGETL